MGRLAPVAVLGAILLLYLGHALYFVQYVNDDAFITFRYSRFLAMGRGPYYNVGEHVEGYTNFLLMLLLAPIIRLGGEWIALPAAKAIGFASGVVSIALAFWLARRLLAGDSPGSARSILGGSTAAGLLAVSPTVAINSMSGLETTLFGACLTAGVALGVDGWTGYRWWPSALAFSAAALTRPEGAALFAVFWVALAGREAVSRWPAAGVPGWWHAAKASPLLRWLVLVGTFVTGVVALHTATRLVLYDGDWLPNTFYAKAGGFKDIGAWDYVQRGGLTPFFGVVGAAAAIGGLLLPGPARRTSAPVLAVAVAGVLLPFLTGTDWMLGWRFEAPYLPLAAVVVAVGWCRIAFRVARRPAWLAAALVGTVIVALAVAQHQERRLLHRFITVTARGYAGGHAALAEWLCGHVARSGDAIALMDIGIIGYRCIEQRIVDVTGLTDRFVGRSPGPFLDKRYDPLYVLNPGTGFVVIVLIAPVEARGHPPVDAPLFPATPSEASLVRRDEFRRWYVRPWPPSPPDASWTERIAQRVGAERVFPHATPGRYYLLAVFRRQDRPSP